MLVLVPLLTFGFALLPYVTLATSLADCTRGPETLADCIPGRLPVHSTVEGQFSLHAGAFSVALKHVPESNHYVPVLSQFRPPLQFELKDGNLTSKGREAYWDPKDPAIFPPLPFRLLFGKPSHPDWASPFVATKCSENGKDVGFLEPLSALTLEVQELAENEPIRGRRCGSHPLTPIVLRISRLQKSDDVFYGNQELL